MSPQEQRQMEKIQHTPVDSISECSPLKMTRQEGLMSCKFPRLWTSKVGHLLHHLDSEDVEYQTMQ